MSMVEGIGDEVLQFFVTVILIVLGLLAWWSTSISEGPLIRTVLILERRSRSRTFNDAASSQQSITGSENRIDTGQGDTTAIQDLVESETVGSSNNGDDKDENETNNSLLLPNNQMSAATQVNSATGDSPQSQTSDSRVSQDNNESPNVDSEASVLRWRRLAFFQNRGPTLLESSPPPDEPCETPASNLSNSSCSGTSGSTSNVQSGSAEEEPSLTSSPDQIRIRLKYLNDDQIVVEGRLQEQLGDFKRRHFRIELAAEKMVRLIFNGQVLQCDSQTLQGYGLFDNCVVHCLVHNQRNNTPRTAQAQSNGSANQSPPPDWNLGTLLYTCLSVMLCFAWYCRYQYSHLFTVTSTAALFGLSGMFAVALLSIYLPDHETIQ